MSLLVLQQMLNVLGECSVTVSGSVTSVPGSVGVTWLTAEIANPSAPKSWDAQHFFLGDSLKEVP